MKSTITLVFSGILLLLCVLIATGNEKVTLTGHTDRVISVSFSPDGTTLAGGSSDGTVLLWNLAPASEQPPHFTADVNADGQVNIQDLFAVVAAFGKNAPGAPPQPLSLNSTQTVRGWSLPLKHTNSQRRPSVEASISWKGC